MSWEKFQFAELCNGEPSEEEMRMDVVRTVLEKRGYLEGVENGNDNNNREAGREPREQ